MSFRKHDRQYDIVVFGATGYTGVLTAEHITVNLPLDLNGPSRVVRRKKVEVCNVNSEEVTTLARKTICLITAAGPYALYGEHAFKACAENGTHYMDCAPEVPWTLAMIKKYEATAQARGACMPQNAMESAPSDPLTWVVVKEVRSKFSSPTGDVVIDLHELPSDPSGGTLATILNLFEEYSLSELRASLKPYAISPVPNSHPGPKVSRLSLATGLTEVPGLGLLSTSATGGANAAIVFRTWGLTKQEPNLQEFYGPNFTYRELMKTRNFITGILMHYGLITGSLLLLLPPFRALLKRFIFKPGEGPDMEEAKKEHIEFQAIARPDIENASKQIFGKLSYTGSMYYLIAALLAQAARTILQDDSERLIGGIYTPACLGQGYIDRLEGVGVKFETEIQHV